MITLGYPSGRGKGARPTTRSLPKFSHVGGKNEQALSGQTQKASGVPRTPQRLRRWAEEGNYSLQRTAGGKMRQVRVLGRLLRQPQRPYAALFTVAAFYNRRLPARPYGRGGKSVVVSL